MSAAAYLAETAKFDLGRWESDRGDVRFYVNASKENLAKLFGYDVEYYKTGNVSSATLNGEKVANSRVPDFSRQGGIKVWVEDGEVYTKGTVSTLTAEAEGLIMGAYADTLVLPF